MCGGSKKAAPVEKTHKFTPSPDRVADTSNDYTAQRRAVMATTETQEPQTFGAELGG
jgi:hypothetical protein